MPVTLSPLRYPGGKTQLCKFVESVMCENNISYGNYVEPFAGGAVSLLSFFKRECKEYLYK